VGSCALTVNFHTAPFFGRHAFSYVTDFAVYGADEAVEGWAAEELWRVISLV